MGNLARRLIEKFANDLFHELGVLFKEPNEVLLIVLPTLPRRDDDYHDPPLPRHHGNSQIVK